MCVPARGSAADICAGGWGLPLSLRGIYLRAHQGDIMITPLPPQLMADGGLLQSRDLTDVKTSRYEDIAAGK